MRGHTGRGFPGRVVEQKQDCWDWAGYHPERLLLRSEARGGRGPASCAWWG